MRAKIATLSIIVLSSITYMAFALSPIGVRAAADPKPNKVVVAAPLTTTTTTTTAPAVTTSTPVTTPAPAAVSNPTPPAPVLSVDPTVITDADRAAWQKVAICETGGNWSVQGSSYSGGVGFANSTWDSYGGQEFAPNAGMATIDQQITVAKRIVGNNVPDQNGCSGGW
jgi:hypothetical protein